MIGGIRHLGENCARLTTIDRSIPTRKGWNSNRRNHNTSGENHRKCPECECVIISAFAKEGALRADVCTECDYVKVTSVSKLPTTQNSPGVEENREVELPKLSGDTHSPVAVEFPFLAVKPIREWSPAKPGVLEKYHGIMHKEFGVKN